jgi:hypothetical protein
MINTFSKFYYGHIVTANNYAIDFTEGVSPEKTAYLKVGSYTLTDFLVEIKRAMDVAGSLTYTVTLNRSTRQITISSTSTFALKSATGTHYGISAFGLIGFTGADRSGASTYTGNVGSGYEYSPPFMLQDYVDPSINKQAVESSVLEAANGSVQVVSFGTKSFAKFKIKYVTDIPLCIPGVLKPTGVGEISKLVSFMEYAITKAPFEFMKDENIPGDFYSVILESTGEEKKGTAYELKELYDKNLPNIYETSLLTLRIL